MSFADVTFNTKHLPWCTREFIQSVVKIYKENSQTTVCLTCCLFDCLKPRHSSLSCRDYIINAHIRDIVRLSKVFRFSDRSDLIAEALIAITDVITNKKEKLEYDKITSFIRSIARNTMMNYIRCDQTFGPKTNERLKRLSCEWLPDIKNGNTVDLLDTINYCSNTNNQRFIIKCVLEGGWTVQQMADELNISLAYVGRIKSELELEIWIKWYKGDCNGKKDSKRLSNLSKLNG